MRLPRAVMPAGSRACTGQVCNALCQSAEALWCGLRAVQAEQFIVESAVTLPTPDCGRDRFYLHSGTAEGGNRPKVVGTTSAGPSGKAIPGGPFICQGALIGARFQSALRSSSLRSLAAFSFRRRGQTSGVMEYASK